jgi:hypothetical protein
MQRHQAVRRSSDDPVLPRRAQSSPGARSAKVRNVMSVGLRNVKYVEVRNLMCVENRNAKYVEVRNVKYVENRNVSSVGKG